MKREIFEALEGFMLRCMADSAHDREHVYRVLYTALELAEGEPDTDLDVLIAACLLHDIGRQAQFADPTVCHAREGAKMARSYLIGAGFPTEFAEKVAHCIETHRFRKNNPPGTMEAKLLFDADKLDVTGAIGIARTLLYQGQVTRPLYTLTDTGEVMDGTGNCPDSFFREYKYKLENIYDRFYTRRGREEAQKRKAAAEAFYDSLLREVRCSRQGSTLLEEHLSED